MRQGEFKSPFTGKVYDRWAPEGMKQNAVDRQGGLGRARAFETPKQRKITGTIEAEERETPEWAKYYPGLAPSHMRPPEKKEKIPRRHAYRAGSFSDIFKQLAVDTIVDLKVSKAESPVWYVEACAGEGEYHVSRLRQPGEEQPLMPWPTAEVLFEALKGQDLSYMPPELTSWMETMRFLNQKLEGFEVMGPDGTVVEQSEDVQWLPSTALVALRRLRKQDPVSLFEDTPLGFRSLLRFVHNFSSKLAPHIEIVPTDGFKAVQEMFVEKKPKADSKAHGRLSGQRGIVLIDPDYDRGSEATRCKDMILALKQHWKAATVLITYPLNSVIERKARRFNQSLRDKDPTLDLLTVELYVENPDWTLESDEEVKWRGVGVVISSPPHTTDERLRAAFGVMCQELSKMPGASKMHVRVERI